MAGSLTDYAENKIVDHTLGKASWTMPTTAYLALFTVAPTDAGGGTEVSGGSYARVAITSTMGSSSGGSSTNSGTITFPTASAGWGTVVAFAVMDALTVGNMIWWGDLTASKTVASGDTLVFNASQLTLSLT
jgi:hypothetical protein